MDNYEESLEIEFRDFLQPKYHYTYVLSAGIGILKIFKKQRKKTIFLVKKEVQICLICTPNQIRKFQSI